MALFCCVSKRDCVGLAAAVSVVLGIIAAFLQITAVITVTPVFLWVTFGIAVVYLAVLLATIPNLRASACSCADTPLTAVLAGILGTILLSVILLAITFVATSIIGAILVGLLVLAFSLTVTATACLIQCLTRTNN